MIQDSTKATERLAEKELRARLVIVSYDLAWIIQVTSLPEQAQRAEHPLKSSSAQIQYLHLGTS
eukprot:652250-Amphidinium_carterae.1